MIIYCAASPADGITPIWPWKAKLLDHNSHDDPIVQWLAYDQFLTATIAMEYVFATKREAYQSFRDRLHSRMTDIQRQLRQVNDELSRWDDS